MADYCGECGGHIQPCGDSYCNLCCRCKPEEPEEFLWGADPDCKHNIISASGGGIKCTKCRGWFCY